MQWISPLQHYIHTEAQLFTVSLFWINIKVHLSVTRDGRGHIEPLSWSVCQNTAPQKHPCLNCALSSQKSCLLHERKESLSFSNSKDTEIHITHTGLHYHMSSTGPHTQLTNKQFRERLDISCDSTNPSLAHRQHYCYCTNIFTSTSTCSLCWAVSIQGPFNGLLLAACQWG